MSVTSGFYNSQNGDRAYDATQMSRMLDGIIDDGVFETVGEAFAVSASSGMTVNVGEGRAWFDHTWTFNDSALQVTIPSSESILNRIDTIVIDVDKRDTVRKNSIVVISGTPATNPVAPGLIKSTDHNQYPICYIYVGAGVTEIIQANITNLVGTVDCPYVTTTLGATNIYGSMPPEMHGSFFRGKNLGSSITNSQKAAIRDGSFDELFVGDYWLMGGHKWRIVDINYWKATGDNTRMLYSPHLVIMPDTSLYEAKMSNSTSNAMANGFIGTDMYKTNLGSAKSMVSNLFGDMLITRRQLLTNEYNTHMDIMSYNWYDTTIEIPDEIMMIGRYSVTHDLARIDGTHGRGQLALFRLAPEFLVTTSYWLRDITGLNYAVKMFGSNGYISADKCDNLGGVRPAFAIG